MRFMGIDGGGSNLRVVITDENMTELVRVMGDAVNPNAVGRDISASRIQAAIKEAMQILDLSPADINGVGIGIAGSSADHAEDWLREIIAAILPDVFVAPASDNEIALVGATGERYGLLLLAGTGSIGFGINRDGETLQVGGWGYLFGDEGSGFWLGQQALKTLFHYIDSAKPLSPFAERIQHYIKQQTDAHIIEWVYIQSDNPVPVLAKLSSVVIDAATDGDEEALAIIREGVDALAELHRFLMQRLKLNNPPIAFAGGLLTSENIFSKTLMQAIKLTTLPIPKYEPMIGAALLAKLALAEYMQSNPSM